MKKSLDGRSSKVKSVAEIQARIKVVADIAVSAPTYELVQRETLWDGKIFHLEVPKDVEVVNDVNVNMGKQYLRFSRPVNRGVVNIYVHGKKPTEFVGENILCRAEVWKKTYDDGRQFICVDFHEIDFHEGDNMRPTHTWRVIRGKSRIIPKVMKGMKHMIYFSTPKPSEGFVIIGELTR